MATEEDIMKKYAPKFKKLKSTAGTFSKFLRHHDFEARNSFNPLSKRREHVRKGLGAVQWWRLLETIQDLINVLKNLKERVQSGESSSFIEPKSNPSIPISDIEENIEELTTENNTSKTGDESTPKRRKINRKTPSPKYEDIDDAGRSLIDLIGDNMRIARNDCFYTLLERTTVAEITLKLLLYSGLFREIKYLNEEKNKILEKNSSKKGDLNQQNLSNVQPSTASTPSPILSDGSDLAEFSDMQDADEFLADIHNLVK